MRVTKRAVGWADIGMSEGEKALVREKTKVCEAAALPKMGWKHWGLASAEELSRHAS